MRTPQALDFEVIDQPEEEPVVLAGQPQALTGEVRFKNPSENKLVLRGAQVRSRPEETKVAALPAVSQALATVVLYPGQQRNVPINLSLSPHTPPGEYRFDLEVAGQVRQVVLHVVEAVNLEISPSEVVIENRPGAKITKRVVFSNRGNVPLNVGEIGAIPLDDELLQCRILRAAVAEVGRETQPLEEYVAEIARQAIKVLDQAGTLRVHNTAGPFVLQPGEVRPVDLEISVPDTLDKRTRYRAAAAIYTTDLEFVIVPAQGEGHRPAGEASRRKQKPSEEE